MKTKIALQKTTIVDIYSADWVGWVDTASPVELSKHLSEWCFSYELNTHYFNQWQWHVFFDHC